MSDDSTAEEWDFNVALARQLTERQRRADANSNVQRIYSRKQIEQAFLETFELVGGIPRLAIWANQEQNYGEFLKLYARFAPKDQVKEAGEVLEYRSNVPPSLLNKPRRDEEAVDGEVT